MKTAFGLLQREPCGALVCRCCWLLRAEAAETPEEICGLP